MVIVEEKAALFTVCENGYGKRTGLENYRAQSRGGVGLKNIKTTARNGKVVALEAVHSRDDLMLITANGMIIRTGLDQIRSIGRNTQGVRLIKLKSGDKLVAAEKIVSESNKPETKRRPNNARNSESASNPGPKAKAKPEAKTKGKPKVKAKPIVDVSYKLSKVEYTPKVYSKILLKEGRLGVVQYITPKEWKVYFPKKTIGVIVRPEKIPPGIFIQKRPVFTRLKYGETYSQVLRHELLHREFPTYPESRILAMEFAKYPLTKVKVTPIKVRYPTDKYVPVGKEIPSRATIAGLAKDSRALYAAKIKTKGFPVTKTVTALTSKEIADIGGLKRIAVRKGISVPRGLERVGTGIYKEVIKAPVTKTKITAIPLKKGVVTLKIPKGAERVYAQYYGEQIGGKLARPFTKPKILVSKKAQLMPPTIIKPSKPVVPRKPLIPPIKSVAVKAVSQLVKPRVSSFVLIPLVKPAIERKKVMITELKPMLKIEPIRKLQPITKITPIVKPAVVPLAKVTPITKVTPVTKVTPILKVLPVTKLIPVTKITPVEVVPTPVISPPPVVFPMKEYPLPVILRGIKKRKKLKRPTKYRPSIVAIRQMIRGRRPRRLTGLEVRPIEV